MESQEKKTGLHYLLPLERLDLFRNCRTLSYRKDMIGQSSQESTQENVWLTIRYHWPNPICPCAAKVGVLGEHADSQQFISNILDFLSESECHLMFDCTHSFVQ